MDPSSFHADGDAAINKDGDDDNTSSSSPPLPVPVESAVPRSRDHRRGVAPPAPYGEDIWDAPVTSATRSAAAVDFATGLPNDLDEIASPLSDHVQDEQLQKSLGDILSLKDDSTRPLDLARGASFKAGKGIFAEASSSSSHRAAQNKPFAAPAMPSYHTPSSTSYRTANSFTAVRTDVENALAQCSVFFEQDASAAPHIYECTAVRQGAQVDFEVTIFSMPDGELLVDVDRMSGCRYSFSEAAADLAQHLQFCSSGAFSSKRALPSCPPAFTPPPSPSSPSSIAAPAVDEAAALCAKNLLSMLGETSPFDQKMQAARAVGALAKQQQSQESVAPTTGNKEPTNCFADRQWADVAERVASLAANGLHGGSAGAPLERRLLEQSEELQVVAMAALADMVAMLDSETTWPREWLTGLAAETVAAGVQEDNHHLRRESLRAAVDLARTAAPQLVRRGIIPHLERAAGGAEDGECEDPLMMRFAEAALVACRA